MSAAELAWLLPGLVYAAGVWRLGSGMTGPQGRLVGPQGRLVGPQGRLVGPQGRLAGPQGRLTPPAARPGDERPCFSVVIAARDEESRIGATLDALAAQTLDPARWEVLVVDDGSRDGTTEQARSGLERLARRGVAGRLLATSPNARGKKRALTLGRQAAVHPWIAALDADSRPHPDWLATLAEHARPGTGLLAAPALFEAHSPFTRWARLEYAGLLGAGLASFSLGRPLFASGANLCWRAEAFDQAGGYQGLEEIASADDTLLIQRLRARTGWELVALADPLAAVTTRAPENLVVFWRQRVRWTSTERHMPDPLARAASLGLYLVFLLCVLALPLALAGLWPLWLSLILILLKLIPDARLVRHSVRRFGLPWSWSLFAAVWLGQLAYGLLVPWFGTFGRVRWRGRG